MENDQLLEAVISKAEKLMKMPKQKLVEVSEDTLLELFHDTETQIIQKTYELADILGFDKIKSVRLVCFRKYNRLGTCDRFCNIEIDFKTLFGHDYNGVISIIIHELCHTEHHNHSKEFWTLFEQSCRKIGILSSEYDGWTKRTTTDDNPFMYIGQWNFHHHQQKYKIIREKICWPHSFGGVYPIRK